MYRAILTVSRDVFHKHAEDLTPRQRRQCLSFIALMEIEQEEKSDT